MTGELLRRISVPELIAQAARSAARHKDTHKSVWESGNVADDWKALNRNVDSSVRRKRAPGGSDENHRNAADKYREAFMRGQGHRPRRYVQETLHISQGTANNWLRAAREKEYLGPALTNTAGERQPEGDKR